MIELYEICYKKIGYEWKIMSLNQKKKKKRSYRTHGVILSILLELLVSGYFNR